MKRRSRSAVVATALITSAFIGSALLTLDATRLARLEPHTATVPSRIYARPFVLYLGMRPDRESLESRLRRLGYVAVDRKRVGPGEYRLGRYDWVIGRRAFRHNERVQPAAKAAIRLAAGRIAAIADSEGRRLSHFALEPEPIGSFAGASLEDRIPVRLEDVPGHLVDAVLTIEDRRFFEHSGLDLKRIAAAAIADLRARRIVQGASTLTQQLAKNLYLSKRRTPLRKLREAAIAVALERRYSKQEILEAYLNEVYLGQGGGLAIHGVGRAAQFYFAKDVSRLDVGESATLAALIRGPNLYSPFRHPEKAQSRRDLVLKKMLERAVITPQAFEQARSQPVGTGVVRRPVQSARYFLDFVSEELRAEFADGVLRAGGFAVFTSLDLRLQRAAEGAVREGLARLELRYPRIAEGGTPLQAALVALDPRNGEILAMVGGRDYGESQFNRAVKARRQPGSSFKPIVALAALSRRGWSKDDEERPFTLASVLHDERFVVQTPQGPWEPENYDRRFRGAMTLRDALERSLNVPFARLGMAVGPERIARTARALGIESPLRPVPSIALGASEVTPLELTRAYGVLAAGGYRSELRPVFVVLDRAGKVLERNDADGELVYDPAEAYLVTSALRGVVERGTGRGLRALGYRGEVAAKSGTTNDFRDGWFIGYTPSLVVGVWVGFDDDRSIGLSGSRVALPIVARFLAAAVGPDGDKGPYGGARFAPPRGLELVEVDPETGLRAGWGCRGEPELFLSGTAPSERCSSHWVSVYPRRAGDSRWRAAAERLRLQLLRLLERER